MYPTFIVTAAKGFTVEVGEYVNGNSRMTTDPAELKELLSSSPHGDTIYMEVCQLFNKNALIRM
jgi:hypothetical protein